MPAHEHPDVVKDAARLTPGARTYSFCLPGAPSCGVRKLASLFKAFLSPAEIDAALQRGQAGDVDLRRLGRDTVAVSVPPRPPS
jgi:hypothetical protein